MHVNFVHVSCNKSIKDAIINSPPRTFLGEGALRNVNYRTQIADECDFDG